MTEHTLHERLARMEAHLETLVSRGAEDRASDLRREERLRALEIKVWGIIGSVMLLLGGMAAKWMV